MNHSEISEFCLSSYLGFRYVAQPDVEWMDGIKPVFPFVDEQNQYPISNSKDILVTLRKIIADIESLDTTALFLSSGIDSAILAALLPKGTATYTIHFESQNGVKEYKSAKIYSEMYGLNHKVIRVTWKDYIRYEKELMINKKAPLHPVEVALYKAAVTAKEEGISTIMLGNGADSTFGGLDKLLKKDWTFDEFVDRYTFVKPETALKNPIDIRLIYEPYRKNNHIDHIAFLKKVHGFGVIQAFSNAISLAGLDIVEPFEKMKLAIPLNIERIRSGEPKYMLVEVFKELYSNLTPPQKIAFARPMDEWLANYTGPESEIFIQELDCGQYTGNQKYSIHCLDEFVSILKNGEV